jgi:hypothetical protein
MFISAQALARFMNGFEIAGPASGTVDGAGGSTVLRNESFGVIA